MRTFLLGIAALAASGCATIGTVQTARPIERGTMQVGIEPGIWRVQDRAWVPTVNVSARYGIGRRWDLGARLGAGGIGFSSKIALTDPRDERVVVSLAPMVGGFGMGVVGLRSRSLHAQVPLIVGVGMRGGHELVLAPKLAAWMLTGQAGIRRSRSTIYGVGGTVGLSLRVKPGVRILPEVGLVQPLLGRADARILYWNVDVGAGVPIYQATIGVLLGGER